jgi:1,4-dihydroxy-2-naphthoate octaprenyltransferase
MQKGAITKEQMRIALILTVVVTTGCGLLLILRACRSPADILGFIAMGTLAMVAAIAYTVGKKPYGYLGLGDLSVMIFFGWLGVIGSNYLQTHQIALLLLLPASGCGLLATAVLNVNNLRDIDSDRQNGKFTLAVRLGAHGARCYHALLLSAALACFALYSGAAGLPLTGWLFLLAAPLLWQQGRFILRENSTLAMRPMLEKTVKTALLINVLFAVGLLLS